MSLGDRGGQPQQPKLMLQGQPANMQCNAHGIRFEEWHSEFEQIDFWTHLGFHALVFAALMLNTSSLGPRGVTGGRARGLPQHKHNLFSHTPIAQCNANGLRFEECPPEFEQVDFWTHLGLHALVCTTPILNISSLGTRGITGGRGG